MKEHTVQTVVVNAFGGPGVGKTTSCWEIASELKKAGYCVEYVSEYAKELVWEGQMELLDGSLAHQQQLFCEQQNRQERLMGKVDLIVTDAPLPQNLLYCREHPPAFYQDMVLNAFQAHTNFNYLMERDLSQPFEERGRIHTLAESQQKDAQLKQFLQESGIYYGTYSHQTVNTLVQNIQAMFERVNQMEYDWEHQDFDTYIKTYVKENLEQLEGQTMKALDVFGSILQEELRLPSVSCNPEESRRFIRKFSKEAEATMEWSKELFENPLKDCDPEKQPELLHSLMLQRGVDELLDQSKTLCDHYFDTITLDKPMLQTLQREMGITAPNSMEKVRRRERDWDLEV